MAHAGQVIYHAVNMVFVEPQDRIVGSIGLQHVTYRDYYSFAYLLHHDIQWLLTLYEREYIVVELMFDASKQGMDYLLGRGIAIVAHGFLGVELLLLQGLHNAILPESPIYEFALHSQRTVLLGCIVQKFIYNLIFYVRLDFLNKTLEIGVDAGG